MALTQSARLPGPSWDEEVVPALRKRLESESRTLAHRMSTLSLSSMDDHPLPNSAYSDRTVRQKHKGSPSASSQQSSSTGAQTLQSAFQPQQQHSNGIMPTATPRVSSELSTKTSFQRKRTYSSPYASDLPNGHPNGNSGPKGDTSKAIDPTRSLSPRPADVKPTRIPKAARTPANGTPSTTNSPYTNGYSHSTAVTPPSHSPELPYQTLPEQRRVQRGVVPSSTQSTVELPDRPSRQGSGLLNESPPFPADATMKSGFSYQGDDTQNEDPPRPSVDSEERPYEHWYRGEVSRNGGVGELRVGRRQEMLDIANYGHAIANKKKPTSNREKPADMVENPRRHRKRADSIAGMTDKERERDSLYLDDEHAKEIGRVLDEHPLTDLDNEGSDINSLLDHYGSTDAGPYAYIPEASHTSNLSEQWTQSAGAHEARSTTPTPSLIPRPSSRQQQPVIPPTRIPGPSSRRSSESRSSSAHNAPSMQRGASEPPQFPAASSSSKTPSPSPPPAPSSSSNSRQPYASATLPASTPQKKGMSPASKGSRTAASKATRAKTTAARKEQEEIANRKSVAYYPSPLGEGYDMADAIPSWTQPVHREGNWDEVVLPVVARKKGLDEHYENADGSPQPKKVDNMIAPAPGTFGFDHSKYRPPRDNFESIPMDEFGRAGGQRTDEDGHGAKLPNGLPTVHEGPHVPSRISPSPAPFSHYAPNNAQLASTSQGANANAQQDLKEEEVDSGGCCKCVIM
ncbi:hypothetical protein B0H34DRAFT_461806 [Crassisporium funariophilum]|nr:hypothetical protein B0H34DRAFT_461806 [Crassisporium funariophilum]